jgi:hypothetical protein
MLHFHKTNEFIGIFFWGGGDLRIIPCMFYMIDRRSLVDVLTRVVLFGNYKKKQFFSHFAFLFVQRNV